MSVPRTIRRAIPVVVRRGLGQWRRSILALSGSIPVALAGRSPRGTVRVFYGHRRIPGLYEHAHGGMVKFQHMQRRFPNSPGRFNLLYLVSSRLPNGAVAMARIAKRKGLRIVWNQNGVAYPAWHGPGWEAVNRPFADLLRAADHVFYQSRFCKVSADRYLGPRDGPWEILCNPVDTRMFHPAPSDPSPEALVLLLGGTQSQRYRLDVALQVLARVRRRRPDATLLVTGRCCWIPDEAEALRLARRLAREAGVERHVTFIGPYSQADAPAIFRRAHLLLHTKYNDPCPSVVIEAMACGLPVIYSHSGGVPELVGDEAGCGVPSPLSWERDLPPDPDAMADAVLEVAADRERFARAARRRAVEAFDVERWIARHQDVFEELCGAPQASPHSKPDGSCGATSRPPVCSGDREGPPPPKAGGPMAGRMSAHRAEGAAGLRFVVLACVVLSAGSGAALLTASVMPFGVIKSMLDGFTADGSADLFTEALFERVIVKARCAALGLFMAATALAWRSRQIRAYLAQIAADAPSFFRDAAQSLRNALRQEEPWSRWALGLIMLAGVGVRLGFLFQPMRYDEAFTFMQYASKPLFIALSHYYPNNHLFHTLLVHVASGVFGQQPWSLRLPAFLAGVLLIPASYVIVRLLYDRRAALLCAALVAGSSALIGFSTVARGYTMVYLFFLLLVGLGAYLLRRRNAMGWLAFAIVSSLGFYTIPLMLYPFGVAVGWLSLSIIRRDTALPRRQLAADLARAVALAAGITLLLYAPMLIASGVNSLTSRGFAVSRTWLAPAESYAQDARAIWSQWNRDLPAALSLLLVLGFAASSVFHRRVAARRVPVGLATLAWCAPVLLLQQIFPPTRVWLFLLPCYFGAAAAGLEYGLTRLGRVTGARLAGAWPAASAALALGLSLHVARTQSVYYSDDTGTGLRNANEIALFLKDRLQPGDRVLTATPSEAPLEYYLHLHRVPVTYLFAGFGFTNRLFVVVNEPRQTLEKLLSPSLAGPEYGPPVLLKRYQFASLYEIQRKP